MARQLMPNWASARRACQRTGDGSPITAQTIEIAAQINGGTVLVTHKSVWRAG